MTHFVTSWRTLWHHDERFDLLKSWWTFDVMACFWRHNELFNFMTCFDFMTNFFYIMTYFWLHDKLLTPWRVFDVMANFLTSWRTFWRHDNDELFEVLTSLLSSWRVFDILTTFLTSWDVFMTSWLIFYLTQPGPPPPPRIDKNALFFIVAHIYEKTVIHMSVIYISALWWGLTALKFSFTWVRSKPPPPPPRTPQIWKKKVYFTNF